MTFYTTQVEIKERKTLKDEGLNHQTLKVEIEFTSSGDTSQLTNEQIVKYILKNLPVIEQQSA